VAWEQFLVSAAQEKSPVTAGGKKVRVHKTKDAYEVSVDATRVQISRKSGFLSSYSVDGTELLKGELRPNFWRAMTDNDTHIRPGFWGPWRAATENVELVSLIPDEDVGSTRRIEARYRLSDVDSEYTLVYTFQGDGSVNVAWNLTTRDPKKQGVIPRLGMCFKMDESLKQVTWYGRGPHESYWDRKAGAAIGLFKNTVEGLYHPYVTPQENGNRTDVRWASFTGKYGRGIRLSSSVPMNFSAWNYSQEDLARAQHGYELPHRNFITVNVDKKQSGVGGTNSWGGKPLERYRLLPGSHSFEFTLSPVFGAAGKVAAVGSVDD